MNTEIRKMDTLKFLGLVLIALVAISGCAGENGHLKTLSESDSKVKQQELIANWSDYHILFRTTALIFDPINDDRTILVGGKKGWWWYKVEDQEAWAEFAKANFTGQGDFSPVLADYPMTGVRELWGPDGQLYGFVICQQRDIVNPQLADVNTLRVWYSRARVGGGR